MVDLELTERVVGSLGSDHAVVADLRKIAHAAQQAVRDTRRPARTGRDLPRAGRLDLNAQQRGRAHDDALQFFCGVQFQTQLHAETVAQGLESCPALVVAPMRVKRGRSSRMELADGPLPTMISMAKSSIAGYKISSTARFSR